MAIYLGMGMERISGQVAAALSIVWWLTYKYKKKMRNYATVTNW